MTYYVEANLQHRLGLGSSDAAEATSWVHYTNCRMALTERSADGVATKAPSVRMLPHDDGCWSEAQVPSPRRFLPTGKLSTRKTLLWSSPLAARDSVRFIKA